MPNLIQSHPISPNLIHSHPISSNLIQSHPISSYIICQYLPIYANICQYLPLSALITPYQRIPYQLRIIRRFLLVSARKAELVSWRQALSRHSKHLKNNSTWRSPFQVLPHQLLLNFQHRPANYFPIELPVLGYKKKEGGLTPSDRGTFGKKCHKKMETS